MIKYAQIINEQTKQCEVGMGTNAEFYRSVGMTEMEVEQAYDGAWYVKGYAPEKPAEIMQQEIRLVRSEYMAETLNKVERYETQKAAGIETTDSAETYRNYLLYLQYLRDVPQLADFPNIEVLTFDDWKETNNSDIVQTKIETESEVI